MLKLENFNIPANMSSPNLSTKMKKAKEIEEDVMLFNQLKTITENRYGIKTWLKKNPHLVAKAFNTAERFIKEVVVSDQLKTKTKEYTLALNSLTTIGNVLSTSDGLKFISKSMTSYEIYDVFVWAALYLNVQRTKELKKQILRCIRYVTRDPLVADHFKNNENLMTVLKISLSPNNPEFFVQCSLQIITNLLDNIEKPRNALKVVNRLPTLELTDIGSEGKGKLKFMAHYIHRKAAMIKHMANLSKTNTQRAPYPMSFVKATSAPDKPSWKYRRSNTDLRRSVSAKNLTVVKGKPRKENTAYVFCNKKIPDPFQHAFENEIHRNFGTPPQKRIPRAPANDTRYSRKYKNPPLEEVFFKYKDKDKNKNKVQTQQKPKSGVRRIGDQPTKPNKNRKIKRRNNDNLLWSSPKNTNAIPFSQRNYEYVLKHY